MDKLIQWLSNLLTSWKPWIVIAPWDIGVRVRLGKTATKLSPGLHFRIPIIDIIFLINTRLRTDETATITLQGSSPHLVQVKKAVFGFKIDDPLKAMLFCSLPKDMITSLIEKEITPTITSQECLKIVQKELEDTGITLLWVKFIDDIEASVLRLLDANWNTRGGYHSSENESRY